MLAHVTDMDELQKAKVEENTRHTLEETLVHDKSHVMHMLAGTAHGFAKFFRDKYSGKVDAAAECPRKRMMHKDGVMSICWSPCGHFIVSGDRANKLRVWHPKTGRLCYAATFEDWCTTVAWSPDGRYIAAGCMDGHASMWDAKMLTTGRDTAGNTILCPITREPLEDPVIAADGHTYSKTAILDWYKTKGNTSPITGRRIFDTDVNPCQHMVRAVKRFHAKARIHTFEHGESVHAVCWSINSAKLVIGGYNVSVGNEPIKVWDIGIRKCIMRMVHDLHDVYSLAWQPGDHRFEHLASTSSAGKTLKVWRVRFGDCRHTFEHSDYVTGVAWSPDGDRIATSSNDWGVRIWGHYSGILLMEMFHDHFAMCVSWSHHGHFLASGGADMSMCVWNADDGTLIREKNYGFQVNDVKFSPNDDVIALASRYSTAKLGKPWVSRIMLQKAPLEPEHIIEYDERGRIINKLTDENGKKIRMHGPDQYAIMASP